MWTRHAAGFAAMGSKARLDVLKVLIRAGDEGLTVGNVQARTGMPASTLAHHLRSLADGGVVVQERRGRTVRVRADYRTLETLADFILSECCADATMSERRGGGATREANAHRGRHPVKRRDAKGADELPARRKASRARGKRVGSVGAANRDGGASGPVRGARRANGGGNKALGRKPERAPPASGKSGRPGGGGDSGDTKARRRNAPPSRARAKGGQGRA